MNICLVSDDFDSASTGIGVHVRCLARELKRRGHEVIVVTARGGSMPPYEKKHGVHIYRMPSITMFGTRVAFSRVRSLKKIFETHRCQLIHLHFFSPLMAASIIAGKLLSLPTMVTQSILPSAVLQQMSGPWLVRTCEPALCAFVGWFMRRACNACDRVLVPSAAMPAILRESGVQPPVELAYYPVAIPGSN